jgi:hypothetical protein
MLAALRHRRGTAADLARLLACWLAAILLVQGLAATLTFVRGPAHRHAEVALSRLGDAHGLAHALGAAHHHDDARDLAMPTEGEAALDAAALMLLATLAVLGTVFGWRSPATATALNATPPWAVLVHRPPPPRKPPRG